MQPSIKALIALTLGLASPLLSAQTDDQVQHVIYLCERGVQLPVTYLSTAQGHNYAVVQVEGQQIAMQQAISASGVRYFSVDAERSYDWHTKGDEGVLSWSAAGSEADHNLLLLKACAAPATAAE